MLIERNVNVGKRLQIKSSLTYSISSEEEAEAEDEEQDLDMMMHKTHNSAR